MQFEMYWNMDEILQLVAEELTSWKFTLESTGVWRRSGITVRVEQVLPPGGNGIGVQHAGVRLHVTIDDEEPSWGITFADLRHDEDHMDECNLMQAIYNASQLALSYEAGAKTLH